MLNASTAVEVLRTLRPLTRVRLSDGTVAEVMCQLRKKCTVRTADRVVLVVNRWELEPLATVEFSEEDLAWFRRPVKEAA